MVIGRVVDGVMKSKWWRRMEARHRCEIEVKG
jgi:hypothetical protein